MWPPDQGLWLTAKPMILRAAIPLTTGRFGHACPRLAVMQRTMRRNGRFPPQGRVSECIRTSLGGGNSVSPSEKATVLGASAGEIPQRVRCGLGITFREDSHGRLHVHALTPGGGAELGGQVVAGDVLVEINGLDVSKLSMGEMADHCIGFPGDEVHCRVLRRTSPRDHAMF